MTRIKRISRKGIQQSLRDCYPTRKPDQRAYLLSVVSDIYQCINSSLASKTRTLLHKDPGLLLTIEQPDPNGYSDAKAFARDWEAYHLLRKADASLIGADLDLATVAISNFHKVERGLLSIEKELSTPCVDFPRDAIVSIARRKITRMLGSISADDILHNVSFSNGASTRLRRREGNPAFKLCGEMHVTSDVEPLLRAFLYEDQVFMRNHLEKGPVHPSAVKLKVVPGSRLTTVSKNAKTDRTIAIEPEGNMLFQKAVARKIRLSLRRVGIDLSDQRLNQELAQYGSFTDSLSTIDLEAASDTISVAIVRELLPTGWFNLLDRIRTKYYTADDEKYVPFVKFSTMGNGFTFELESLIFYALTWATMKYFECDGHIGVFGDDIIAPVPVTDKVIRMLELCGFKVNTSKSFISGPFRESCGKHYFLGTDVSPFMLTKLKGDITDPLSIFNKLRDWQRRLGFPVTSKLSSFDPYWLPRVPPSYGFRAGIIDHDSDLYHQSLVLSKRNYHSFYFLSYEQSLRKVPDFGNYYCKMITHNFTASAEEGFIADAGHLVVRKSNQVSVWN